MNKIIQKIFIFSLFLSLLCSFYIFIDIIVLKNKYNAKIFSTWQFPMLFAIFIDTIYHY